MVSSSLKANRMLGFLRKGVGNKREAIVVPLYISRLCPCLEHECNSGPCQKDIDRTGKDSKENSDERCDMTSTGDYYVS